MQQSSTDGGHRYIPLSQSIAFLLGKKRLLGWSLLLFIVTIFFTWITYQLCVTLVDDLTAGFFSSAPETATLLGWLQHKGWLLLQWLYLFTTRIIAFYLAFLLAYTVTTPGYVFLSASAEKLQAGSLYEEDAPLTVGGVLLDLYE
ncbi:MAG: cysteine biosynthesis protein, partial [Desulfopila sp.]